MNKRILIYLVTACLLAACGNDGSERNELTFRNIQKSQYYLAKMPNSETFGIENKVDIWWPKEIDRVVEKEMVRMLLSDSNASTIDEAVERFMKNDVNRDLLADASNVEKAKSLEGVDNRSYAALQVRVECDENLLTISSTEILYVVKAAHPITLVGYVSYDIEKHDIVRLKELINVESAGDLAKRAIMELPQNAQVKEGTYIDLRDGSMPEPDDFYIDLKNGSIVMVYQQYSIAPYACGIQYVDVPAYWLVQKFGGAMLTEYGKKLLL